MNAGSFTSKRAISESRSVTTLHGTRGRSVRQVHDPVGRVGDDVVVAGDEDGAAGSGDGAQHPDDGAGVAGILGLPSCCAGCCAA
jgi:hypothetical protein